MKCSRREFVGSLLGATILGLIDLDLVADVLGQTVLPMRRMATQTASAEGKWTNLTVEGRVPKEVNGTLYRTAPGQSQRFGTTLRHLFDGDAYLAGWRFDESKVTLHTRFVPTPGRAKELESAKMLYDDYGTLAPGARMGGKNQPSVNVIEWRGKLLGLSEGGLPTSIDPVTFDFLGYEDFQGVVPGYLTFTAHPRFDPVSGDMYAWGFEKRPPGTMHVIHVSRETGKAQTLYKLPQTGFNMVHDAVLTENYFVVIIHPTSYDMRAIASGGAAMGEALRFAAHRPSILYAFQRRGNVETKPLSIELPPSIVYHYGNAYEPKPEHLVFEMIAYDDGAFFEFLQNWRDDRQPSYKPPRLKRLAVDLSGKTPPSISDLAEDMEFPRFDTRLAGKKARYLYGAIRLYDRDASIARIDLEKREKLAVKIGPNRTIAEPVFVPSTKAINEDRGWLFAQGYDVERNENFLEIRDAQTLDFVARVWAAGQHFPLGFHGNFSPSTK